MRRTLVRCDRCQLEAELGGGGTLPAWWQRCHNPLYGQQGGHPEAELDLCHSCLCELTKILSGPHYHAVLRGPAQHALNGEAS